MKRIWLAAAENGALPGGKVGGVGDVIRDLPLALAGIGLQARVVTPSYGMFHKLPKAKLHRKIAVKFAGDDLQVEVYRLTVGPASVEHFVIEHPLFSPCGPGQIYVNDTSAGPYEVDANKFAFFNAALAAWVNISDTPPEVIHLHDWHTGLLPALRDFGKARAPLKKVRMVFTIHNLAYQGVRPLRGIKSSLQAWFPHLLKHAEKFADPVHDDCINFMATAIRLSDAVNTVSPSYAMEVQQPSDPGTGFSGGEGLESELKKIHKKGRLAGILNGCMYPDEPVIAPGWNDLLKQISKHPKIINASRPAKQWLRSRKDQPPENLMLSIGRVVDQKVPLFLEPVSGYDSALEAILATVGAETLFIMLGNGDKDLEQRFVDIARSNDNFLFLRGYVDALSAPLYASADLFLMPSSFEPCGISQMLSMRAGQPCVVHAVGGLKDTVEDNISGFVFDGDTPGKQATNFVSSVQAALKIKRNSPKRWQKICSTAANQRFSWELAAKTYQRELYKNA